MLERKLTKAQKQILHDQTIEADRPGTILRDFQSVLDFMGTGGIKAAGKYNLFPIDKLDELNQRLSRPLSLALKRPQLRSYPHLQGLYLLLRASGLSRVAGGGVKARLVLDPAALEQWNRLNPTEQYFTLLEAWLRVGQPEMTGEQQSSCEGLLMACLQAWQSIPAKGRIFPPDQLREDYLHGIWRDFYHVGLMDMFGLMEVVHPRKPIAPWRPAAMYHTPFGDAVFTLLNEWDFTSMRRRMVEEQSTEEVVLGRWQPLFQPYFPEWRNNLALPKPEAREGVFVFRVSLGKPIWRLIALPADCILDELVGCILRSFRFDSDHLYEFTYRDRFGAMVRVNDPRIPEGPWTDEVRIGDLPLGEGESISFLYDFGDSWKFDVRLERIDPPSAATKKPRILEKHGKSPEQYPDQDGW
jgi:Plasmid pRiA4b ORF-3-like protein